MQKKSQKYGLTVLKPLHNGRIGKAYYINDAGKLESKSYSPSIMSAVYRQFDTPREFYDEIVLIQRSKNRAIMLDKPIGIETDEPFYILSRPTLNTNFGQKSHRGDIYQYKGRKCIGRFKENFQSVDIFLLDHDGVPANSNKSPYSSPSDLIDDLEMIIPGFKTYSHIVTYSSSYGVQRFRNSTRDIYQPKFHIYLFVNDGKQKTLFKTYFEHSAGKLGFLWPNQANGVRAKTIVDLSTLSATRLVFESIPIFKIGIIQKRPEPEFYEGTPMNVTSLIPPSQHEQAALAKKLNFPSILVYDTQLKKIIKTRNIFKKNSYIAELSMDTKYVEIQNKAVVKSISDYTKEDGNWIPIISECRCGMSQARFKTHASEYLFFHNIYGPCIYEHDGNNIYIIPPMKKK